VDRIRLAWSQLRQQIGQLAVAVTTIALGVALAASMLLANASLQEGFETSIDALAGRAELQVTSLAGGPIDEGLVEVVRGVSGVRTATALLVGSGFLGGARNEGTAVRVVGVDLLDDAAVRFYRTSPGGPAALDDALSFLNQPDSAVVTKSLAARLGLERGDELAIELPRGSSRLTVRGVLSDDGVGQASGGKLVVMDLYAAQDALGMPARVSQVDVLVDPGVTPERVGALLRAALPDHVSVVLLEDRREALVRSVAAFQMLLDLIGAFALLLAVLITGNRLATIYQERLWEMGVMRALGVSRARLVRELLLEAALLATVAVAIGLPIGIAFAQIIVVPVADTMTLNFKEAVTATWVAPRPLPLLFAAAGGVLTALAAALFPASQAVRKSVVSVLARGRRRDAVSDTRSQKWARVLVPILAFALLLLQPVLARGALDAVTLVVIAAAGALLLVPVLRLAGEPIGRLFGVPATIGVQDQSRTPSRAIGAAAVLMTGVAIAIWIASIGESFERYVVEAVMKIRRGDLVVESIYDLGAPGAGRPVVSDRVVDEIAATEGVEAVGAYVIAKANDPETGLLALDPIRLRRAEFGDWALEPGAMPGALELVARGDAVLIDTNLATQRGVEVGRPFRLSTPSGPVSLPVAGVLRTVPTVPSGDVILSREVYRRLWKDATITRAFVLVAPGHSIDQVRRSIQGRVGSRYRLQVTRLEDLSRWFASGVRDGFAFARVMAVITLVVVLFGTGDALAANVLERTREIGTLRALGLSAAQVRTMVLSQALAIGVAGSGLAVAVGMGAGLAFVWLLRPLLGWEMELYPTFGIAFAGGALGVLACVLGAVVPAMRAARFPPAAALRYD